MSTKTCQQISYIAPAAPGRRRPATEQEPFLRPEIGFTPNWYYTALGIDFGKRWHTDPAYRRETVFAMRDELKRRFPDTEIGGINRPDKPLDILTGTYSSNIIAAIYGIPIVYFENNWPNCEHQYLSDEEVDNLKPPDLDTNPIFQDLMSQVDWIAGHEGRVEGFINWQGVLNNAQRLRGEKLFYDMSDNPERCRRLFDYICTTMIEAEKRLHKRQRQSGVEINFTTISNCLVNMVSPQLYRELLLPFDLRIQRAFGCIAIHNCAWNADPYIEDYAMVPNLGYIDMGIESNLARARELIPNARRALMYTPMDLANKSTKMIRADLEKIARDYAPCDIVIPDIDSGLPDERVLMVLEWCNGINFKRDN